MAITCRVFEPQPGDIEAIPAGFREKRVCAFFADAGEIEGVDWSEFYVDFLHADTLAMQRSKLTTAAETEAARLGYGIARSRVVFPDMNRGS